MTLSEILSQEKAVRHLKAMISTGRIPPSLLFCGPAGCGKFPTAMAFAAALNCTRTVYEEKKQKTQKKQIIEKPADDLFSLFAPPEKSAEKEEEIPEKNEPIRLDIPLGEACGKCLSCRQIINEAHPDIIITSLEKQNEKTGKESGSLKVDTIREILERAYQKASISPYKIFIIKDAEKLLPEAQNAILKTLEAPPPGTVMILLTADKNALLPTILSRAAEVDFGPLSHETIKTLLKKEGIDESTADFLSKSAQGSLDKARDIKLFMERALKLRPGDRTNAFRFAAMLPKDSHQAREETKAMLDFIIGRQREIWSESPDRQSEYAKLISGTLNLRSLMNRNVSTQRILEAALIASEAAGISIERLLNIS